MNSKIPIYDLPREALLRYVEEQGQPAYRVEQIWKGIYQRLANDPDQLTDLPATLRERLAQDYLFNALQASTRIHSQDGRTTKILFTLQDGPQVEAVLMRYDRRRTACISTQVGCAMGCVFCATGQMGFKRNLTSGEIIEQVLYIAGLLHEENQRLTNVVVMGMGEPFHNYEATLAAIDRLADRHGFNMGARRFTISTVGIVPAIERFTDEMRQNNLAISLHAATDALRDTLLPVNRRYPLQMLMKACRAYVLKTGRRISFEWALIHGVNDNAEQAERLAKLVAGLKCHVNLIPLNPTHGYAGDATPDERAEAFRRILSLHKVACTIRVRRGIDIHAGCGQLATQQEQ